MTKFVILGSCRFEPYEILAVPNKIPGAWNTDEGYKIAAEKFHPAMDEADVILLYAPDGIGRHTMMDIDYATDIGKTVYALIPLGGVVSSVNWGYCEADEQCPDFDNGSLTKDLPYQTWGCGQCNHLRTERPPALRGVHISVWCDKDHTILGFFAKDKEEVAT